MLRLTEPFSPMLNYCRLEPQEHHLVNINITNLFSRNGFETIVCKMEAVLLRPQHDKSKWYSFPLCLIYTGIFHSFYTQIAPNPIDWLRIWQGSAVLFSGLEAFQEIGCWQWGGLFLESVPTGNWENWNDKFSHFPRILFDIVWTDYSSDTA